MALGMIVVPRPYVRRSTVNVSSLAHIRTSRSANRNWISPDSVVGAMRYAAGLPTPPTCPRTRTSAVSGASGARNTVVSLIAFSATLRTYWSVQPVSSYGRGSSGP